MGIRSRIATINESYRVLRPGGYLFMELMSQDVPGGEGGEGMVCKYERIMRIDGVTKSELYFYLKDFRFNEVANLIRCSLFDPDKTDVFYMLSRDYSKPDDYSDIGRIVGRYAGFTDFDIAKIQPIDKAGGPRYDYRILLSVKKDG